MRFDYEVMWRQKGATLDFVESYFRHQSAAVIDLIAFFFFRFLYSAWVASLALSLRPCLGLISGPLCDRFGCRTVTICGSVLCTASLIASSYVTRLELMYVTYGVVYGIGSSFIFTSCLLITAQYFTKWRPLAITIVSGGIGAGILALGPTIHVLVDFFGWQGALRFVAGAMAFVAVLSYSYDEKRKILRIMLSRQQTTLEMNWHSQT